MQTVDRKRRGRERGKFVIRRCLIRGRGGGWGEDIEEKKLEVGEEQGTEASFTVNTQIRYAALPSVDFYWLGDPSNRGSVTTLCHSHKGTLPHA